MKKLIIGAMIAVSLIGSVVLSGCADEAHTAVNSPQMEQGVVITEQERQGLELKVARLSTSDYVSYNVSPQTETAYTLTASYKPSYVTNAELSWSVAFVNGSSAWASGKTATDYVSVAPASASTAVVSVKKAFGEQIKVIVKSVSSPNVSASVICDYNAQALGGSISLSHIEGGHSSAGAWNFAMFDFGAANTAVTVSEQHTGTHTVAFNVNFSDGTKTPTTANNYVSVYFANTSFYDTITAGHTLLTARSDIGSIATKTDSGVEIDYKNGDEINLDLPGIDLLTDAAKTLVIQSRDYMLGYTSETPDNWDNGETYAAYCQIMNASTADLSGKITLHVEDGKVAGENCYTNLVWKNGYFNCPILSITLDETRLEF